MTLTRMQPNGLRWLYDKHIKERNNLREKAAQSLQFPAVFYLLVDERFLGAALLPSPQIKQNKLAQIIYSRAVLLSAFDSHFYIVIGFADCKLKSMQCGLLVSITECIMVELKTCNRVIIRFTDSVKRVSGTHQSITATLTRF